MNRQAPPLVLAALAFVALAALWFAPGPAANWRRWQPPEPQAPNLDDALAAVLRLNSAAGAAYPEVLARPLLNPSRRPQPPAGAASGPAAPQPTAIEQVTIQGIVNGPTLTGVFLQDAGQSRFVRRGEKVGDWTLEGIEEREIVFRRGGEQRRVELLPAQEDQNPNKDKGSKGAAAPARAQAVAAPPPPPPRPMSVPTPVPASAPAGAAAEPASAPARARGAFGGGSKTPRTPANGGAAPR